MSARTRPFDALLFDFDGTLSRLTIDFSRLRRKITALAEAFLGEEPEPSDLPVLEWIGVIADEVALIDEDLGKQFHTRGRLIIQATELDAARDAELFPDTRPLLAGLRAAGVKTGILTRNSTAAVKAVFPDVAVCCDAFLAREDTPNVKPHPDHARLVRKRLAVAPEQALLVGDHPHRHRDRAPGRAGRRGRDLRALAARGPCRGPARLHRQRLPGPCDRTGPAGPAAGDVTCRPRRADRRGSPHGTANKTQRPQARHVRHQPRAGHLRQAPGAGGQAPAHA
jgi:phosphoglycolate phosphatase